MGKNLLLANLKENYSFVNSEEFMTSEIDLLFQSYFRNTGKKIEEVLLITYAFYGNDLNAYVGKVRDLFSNLNATVKLITENDDPVQMINNAQSIVVGGGRMDLLEDSLGTAVRNALKSRIDSGIPYIGWNEGSVLVCPNKIDNLGALSSNLLSVVPFQYACHYNDTPSNRISIEDFLIRNPNIKYAVCFSDQSAQNLDAGSSPAVSNVVGSNSEEDEEGSGIRIEESNAGLAGTEGAATTVKLYKLVDGSLYNAPLTELGNII